MLNEAQGCRAAGQSKRTLRFAWKNCWTQT